MDSYRRGGSVRADHTTLRSAPSGTDTRYTITLRGSIDDNWAEAFRGAQAESTNYRRYHLEREAAAIWFSCRTVDGTPPVFEALERLETMLALVNEQVETWRAQESLRAVISGSRSFV